MSIAHRSWPSSFACKVSALLLVILGVCGIVSKSIYASPQRIRSSSLGNTIAEWKVSRHGWHRAVLNTLIRQNESLASPVVQTLSMGMFVHVIDHRGRRAKVDYPAHGWASLESATGQAILLWDDPEARNKNVWNLPQHERDAVLEAREVLRLNSERQRQAFHDEKMRQGIKTLVHRYQTGELQKSLEDALSENGIRHIQSTVEDGIQNVGNATQKVLHALSENQTRTSQLEAEVRRDNALLDKQREEWKQKEKQMKQAEVEASS